MKMQMCMTFCACTKRSPGGLEGTHIGSVYMPVQKHDYTVCTPSKSHRSYSLLKSLEK